MPTKDWSTQEWLRFLRALPEKLPLERMAELDAAFGLTERGNAEIADQWLLIAVRNGYHPADARLEDVPDLDRPAEVPDAALQGADQDARRALRKAKAIYARARPFYHPIAVDSVDKLLGVKP